MVYNNIHSSFLIFLRALAGSCGMDWQDLKRSVFYTLPVVICFYITWRLFDRWRGKGRPPITPFKVVRAPKPEEGGKKRVCAILGSTGFVGSHVVDEFVRRRECRVYMLGRKFRPERTNPAADALIQVDMQDFDGLVNAFQGVDSVIDVAAAVPTVFTSVDDIWRINKQGLENVVKAAQKAGVKNLVFICGLHLAGEVHDTHAKAFIESIYWGERYVTDINGEKGLQTCAILPGNIVGLRSDFIESLISGKMTSFPLIDRPTNFLSAEYLARAVANAEQKLVSGCEDVAGKSLPLVGDVMSFKQFLSLPTWPHKFSSMPLWVLKLLAKMNVICAKLTGCAPLGVELTPAIVTFFDLDVENTDSTTTYELLDLGPPPPIKDCVQELMRQYRARP